MSVLAQGRRLAGRFGLVRPIGRGAGGEVWLATAPAGVVALKFPADDAAAAAEAAVGARLVHPHIVRVAGCFRDGPLSFIAMQYLAGAASCGRLRAGGCRAILRSLTGVAAALEYLHGQGIVHGDLKPSNILCAVDGHAWLCDFGAAVAGGGNLPAMSPQRLDGAPATVSDDVYGFGALLYDLLAGQPLFHPDVTARRIRDEVPVLPDTDLTGAALPSAFRGLLRSLLAKDPADRPAGMAAVRAVLARCTAPGG